MKYSDRHISDEELDQLFRDAHASEGQESLFVPEFWSEMEAMLPAEKKTRRGIYWIPVAATAVLITVLIFYPQNAPQISTLKQKNTVAKNEKDLNAYSVHTKNSGIPNTHASTEEANHTKIKTYFRVLGKHISTDSRQKQDLRLARTSPLVPSREHQTLEDWEMNPERSENVVAVPGENAELTNELDSIHLEPRNEKIIHDEVAALPKISSKESNQWYVELGPTVGQSPYLSPGQKRNVVGGAVLGGGYTKRIDNAFVSIGLQARLEGFGGLNYQETNFSQNIVRTVSVKQLYSLELPLKFGYTFRRSEFAFGVVPGLQLFIHGKEKITEGQVVKREETFTGKVEHSNSLTMEFGFQYYYNFSSGLAVGAKLNADILRPFHTDYYLGKSAGLPVNGQIVLRATISK